MTTAVKQLLASFDQLSRADQVCAAKEIQNRVMAAPIADFEVEFSPLTNEQLAELADELFQLSEVEEARRHGAA
jgi:hypothetical protein